MSSSNDSPSDGLYERVSEAFRKFGIVTGMVQPKTVQEVMAPPSKPSGYDHSLAKDEHLDHRVQKMSIRDAAKENCSDLELDCRNCKYGNGLWNSMFANCTEQEKKWNLCLKRQEELLRDLGFQDKRRSIAELNWIWRRSDRLGRETE